MDQRRLVYTRGRDSQTERPGSFSLWVGQESNDIGLEKHYPDDISGIGVFFFRIFYLQYKINRLGAPGEDRATEMFYVR